MSVAYAMGIFRHMDFVGRFLNCGAAADLGSPDDVRRWQPTGKGLRPYCGPRLASHQKKLLGKASPAAEKVAQRSIQLLKAVGL